MALTNSDCTIFSRSKDPSTGLSMWGKQHVPKCWWFVETKSTVTTEGLKSADILKSRIYDLSIKVKKDDYIVKGNCPVVMETVKDLAGYEYFKVTTANYNAFGDNPHIKVVGA